MVRLVFRPYTQVRRSICTSEPLRASTRVSSGFTLLRHSSPSFGSQQIRSHSKPATAWPYGSASDAPRVSPRLSHPQKLLSLRPFQYTWVSLVGQATRTDPNKTLPTRVPLALLGPCFKTGHRVTTPRQSPGHSRLGSRPGRDAVKCSPCRTPTPLAEAEWGENGTRCRNTTQPPSRPELPRKEEDCTFPFRTNGRPNRTWKTTETTVEWLYVTPGHPRATPGRTSQPPTSTGLRSLPNWRSSSTGDCTSGFRHRLNSTCSTTTSTPWASLPTVSRSVELSLQSAFHLSLTVLVSYRSRVRI